MAYKVSVKGMDKLEKAFENGVKGVTGCMKRSVYSGADVIADSVRANLAGALKRAEVKGYQIILTSHGDLEKSLTISRIVTIDRRDQGRFWRLRPKRRAELPESGRSGIRAQQTGWADKNTLLQQRGEKLEETRAERDAGGVLRIIQ